MRLCTPQQALRRSRPRAPAEAMDLRQYHACRWQALRHLLWEHHHHRVWVGVVLEPHAPRLLGIESPLVHHPPRFAPGACPPTTNQQSPRATAGPKWIWTPSAGTSMLSASRHGKCAWRARSSPVVMRMPSGRSGTMVARQKVPGRKSRLRSLLARSEAVVYTGLASSQPEPQGRKLVQSPTRQHSTRGPFTARRTPWTGARLSRHGKLRSKQRA
mmetsp:Transcript_3057/g.8909  ORF Transcript_3057/g.8909 Transcript_3057/m.8909 type:complete len:215 (-) Transcript_3057:319-963(-)